MEAKPVFFLRERWSWNELQLTIKLTAEGSEYSEKRHCVLSLKRLTLL